MVTTLNQTVKELNPSTIEGFKKELRGKIIIASDSQYDETRKIFNAMIDKRPGMFVMCADVADVIASVNFVRENNLCVAIRGGGHNGGGLGLCDDGLVIDLSGIKFVRVDTSDNTVRVGGGNLWGEVDHATHAFGLAVPAGIISSTGVGGLTLGGGVGYLSRKYGLTIDNLVEADMVLADGSFVTVNKDQHKDLFWAIRGGGSNFGVVTSFKFQGHKLKTVIGGPTLWPIERTEEIIEFLDDFIHKASEDMNGFIATMVIPGAPFPEYLHNKKFCGAVWCYTGDPKKFDEIFQCIRDKNPIFEHVGEMPYPAIQTMFDSLYPPGYQWYWRGDFFKELNPDLLEQHFKFSSKIPTAFCTMHLYPITGAASRVGQEETAWAYRDAKYSGVIVGVDPVAGNKKKISNWCKDYWEAIHQYSAGGAYTNFMMDEGQDRVIASYKHNYQRLVEIKTKFDPNNLFRVNQNIVPLIPSESLILKEG